MKKAKFSAKAKTPTHEALFAQPTVHFTLTTHLGRDLDLRTAVRQLLGDDVAVSAAWPSELGIRVTPSMRKLARTLERTRRLKDDADRFRRERTARSLTRFVLRHPLIMWRGIARGSGSTEELEPSSGDGSIDEALEFGQEVILNAQKISAVEREMDARLFGGQSRDFDRFVRLNLRGSYHDIRLPASSETAHVVFEPRLLLHSSGVLQLTIAVPLHARLTTSQLIHLSRSDRMEVAASQVPEPLLALQTEGTWADELDAGARLFVRDVGEGLTLADLIHEHLLVVRKALKRRGNAQWNIHATVFASAGACCKEQDSWRNMHSDDAAQVAARYQPNGGFDRERLRGINLALETDRLLTTNIGSTTLIDFRSGDREPFHELNTVLLVEHVMLQYARLQDIEGRVAKPRLYGKKLTRLQRDSVDVFTDMRQHELRYGSAREIATRLLNELGAQDMRRTIETALGLASQSDATHQATVQSRRSMVLTVIATVLAVLVAIPALQDLLTLVSQTPDLAHTPWLLAPFKWFASLGGWGPWAIIAVILAAVVTWWLFRKLWWALRFLVIVVGVIVGRRGPLVPQSLTLTADLRESTDSAMDEEEEKEPGLEVGGRR